MLSIFRNNQASTAVILLVVIALLRWPALAGWVAPLQAEPDGAGVLYAWFFGWSLSLPLLSAVAAVFLVWIQALLVNWLVISSKINPERNWLAALLYAVVVSSVRDFMYLSPALVAVTFVPLALRIMFKLYKSHDTTLLVFDTSMMLAIAGLFYVPTLWLAPLFLLAILYLRTVKLPDIVVFSGALFVPGFIGWAIAVWKDRGYLFVQKYTQQLFQLWDIHLDTSWDTLSQITVLGIMALTVLAGFNTYYHKRLIQVQKYNNILYWILLGALFSMLLRHAPQAGHLLPAGVTTGIFLALSLQEIRNRLIAEVLFLALLALIYSAMLLPSIS